MPGYSPEPWSHDKDYGAIKDAADETVCMLPLNVVAEVNGLLIAHAIPLLDALRKLYDAAEVCDPRTDLDDALERALALLEKLE